MNRSGFLVDTSAFIRMARNPSLRERWRNRADAGLLVVCPLSELEILHGARSKAHRQEMTDLLKTVCRWVVMPDRIYDRATAVQEHMTDRGTHRSAGAVDLLVAATAEEHRSTLLHCDKDFVHVAAITGQSLRWLDEMESIN